MNNCQCFSLNQTQTIIIAKLNITNWSEKKKEWNVICNTNFSGNEFLKMNCFTNCGMC